MKRQKKYSLNTYSSLAKKGPWAVQITLCSDGVAGGRIFVTPLHFTTPMFTLSQPTTGYCTPAQHKLNSI